MKFLFFSIIFLLLTTLSFYAAEAKLLTAFMNYFMKNDERVLNAIIHQIQMPELIRKYGEIVSTTIGNVLVCTVCRTAIDSVIFAKKAGMTRNELFILLSKLCVKLGLETEIVCQGLLEENLDILLYIVDNGQNVSGRWACSVLLQSFRCPKVAEKDWTIELDNGYSPVLSEDYSNETVKLLHISDLHYDELYTPGSNAACKDLVCCVPDSGKVENTTALAGYWGDYRHCDTPWYAVLNSFENIRKTQDVAYVYFTGDIISHRVWMTSKSYNTRNIITAMNLIDEYFSTSQIFPVLGNHEVHPFNLFAPESITGEFSTKWLFELIQQVWSKWLPESTSETIRKGGYYTVKVNNKFRVIALNSNVCHTSNFWLLYDNGDIYGQLAWLRDVLSEAEANGESVHILGHIPTGSSVCYETWAREYRRIIIRYANNIKAIFNGHTHINEFGLFFNTSESSNPLLVAFNGGSITTYYYLNPNYVVYEADAGNLDILDAETYIYNLTAANLAGSDTYPNWERLCSFRESYGVNSLRKSELNNFVEEMASNRTRAQLYHRNKYLNSDPVMKQGYDDRWLLKDLCDSVTSLFSDTSHCLRLQQIWDRTRY